MIDLLSNLVQYFHMQVVRYSAAAIFGAPIEKIDPENNEGLVGLVRRYGIEPEAVPTEPTDITPYYWMTNSMIFFASQPDPGGPAVIDLFPKHDGADTLSFMNAEGYTTISTGVRRLEIPTLQPTLAIIGSSPRFAGQLCVHEVITAV